MAYAIMGIDLADNRIKIKQTESHFEKLLKFIHMHTRIIMVKIQ